MSASSVNASGNGTITAIDENNPTSGGSTLSVSNWWVSGNAGAISGWLHDVNVGLGDIRVDIAGTLVGSYDIPPGGNSSANFPGTFSGPVHVVSHNGQSIFTTDPQIYGSSFSESTGIGGNRLTTHYWFPWYDGQYMRTQVRIGKP